MKSPKYKKPPKISAFAPWKGNEPGVEAEAGFADNRSEAVAQRKLQAGMSEQGSHAAPAQLRKAMHSGNGSTAASAAGNSSANGLPAQLKSGIENLSGYAMDDVKVHYNSDKPAQLRAHAYAQGTDIHLAPGQEKHLPHEAWHVVQQKQGRVAATRQLKGKTAINDDAGLEREADEMGAKALRTAEPVQRKELVQTGLAGNQVVQRVLSLQEQAELDDFEAALDNLIAGSQITFGSLFRLISIDVLYSDARVTDRTMMSFLGFIYKTTDPNDDMDSGMATMLTTKFGVDQVEELKEAMATAAGSKVAFNTRGVNYNYFKADSRNRTLRTNMRAKFGNIPDNVKDRLMKSVIETGISYPEEVQVAQGTKFYKLMPPGLPEQRNLNPPKEGFMETLSSYYITAADLGNLARGSKVADTLGLPFDSYQAYYLVYEIEARVATSVFKSKIAPTRQHIKKTNEVLTNLGGKEQILILDSSDNNIWEKKTYPKYLFDPDEAEYQSLLKGR